MATLSVRAQPCQFRVGYRAVLSRDYGGSPRVAVAQDGVTAPPRSQRSHLYRGGPIPLRGNARHRPSSRPGGQKALRRPPGGCAPPPKAGTSRRGALQNAAALQLPTSRSRCCRISRRRRSSRWRTNIEKTSEDAYRLTMVVAERRIPGGWAVDATCRIERNRRSAKAATIKLTAPAYWKFESSPLLQRVVCERGSAGDCCRHGRSAARPVKRFRCI
jgi:hypothetical protein